MNWITKHTPAIRRALDTVGYDARHWTRPVMYDTCTQWLEQLPIREWDTLEISAGWQWKTLPFRTFNEATYPDFDICQNTTEEQFDLIIADQVFEHLLWPYRAAQNIFTMLKPGGYFLMTTPFMIRVHAIPYDCTRWTETGMKYFLAESGFPLENTRTGSWGNRACVKANFNRWARRGWFGSLKNEPNFPVAVWALAQKPLLGINSGSNAP